MFVSEGRRESVEEGSEELLRAKYLDYCSAQLADLLLYLTPDEIFVLSEKISRDDVSTATTDYGRMVQVATKWLAERVALPPFEVWVRDYRKNPDRYDRYLMGLWESVEPGGTSGTGEGGRRPEGNAADPAGDAES